MSTELIIAMFENDEERAGKALENAQKLAKDGSINLHDIAAIVKHKDGKVEIKDIGDVRPKKGAVFGAITGGLIGLAAGPGGAIIGAIAGAATGGGAAKLIDYGVSEDMIKEVEEKLQPGSSAVIAYAEMSFAESIVRQLEESGATVIHETLESQSLDDMADGYGRTM